MTITSSEEFVATKAAMGRGDSVAEADPITTEVIRHGLNSAAEQMKIALRRTAFSPVIYEMIDFCCALYDRDIRLLAQAQALPAFLGTMNFCVEACVRSVGGEQELEEGDIIFSTYGFDIGSHSQDAAVVAPAFVDGELVGYAAVKAHHLDIGAKEPYCTDTTDNFQEGTIFPGVKLYRRGELQQDMFRTIVANSRLPVALQGDLNAEILSLKMGVAALTRLIERYGLATFTTSVERMFDHGEAVLRTSWSGSPTVAMSRAEPWTQTVSRRISSHLKSRWRSTAATSSSISRTRRRSRAGLSIAHCRQLLPSLALRFCL